MRAYAKTIKVPKTDDGAHNPKRAAGKLLQSQTLHLREALLQHLHDLTLVLAIDPRTLKTEEDVSGYIRKAMAILHTHSARSARK
jgi:hypothetical protein